LERRKIALVIRRESLLYRQESKGEGGGIRGGLFRETGGGKKNVVSEEAKKREFLGLERERDKSDNLPLYRGV